MRELARFPKRRKPPHSEKILSSLAKKTIMPATLSGFMLR
jgi:hypothetical protein